MQAGAAAQRRVECIDWNRMPAACLPDTNFKGAWNERQVLRAERKRLQVASFALVLLQILPQVRMRGGSDFECVDAAATAGSNSAEAPQPATAVHAPEQAGRATIAAEQAGTLPSTLEQAARASSAAEQAGTAVSIRQHRLKVVDFGSGSGNLTLPLAWLFPDLQFEALDYNEVAIALLRERAAASGLDNVTGVTGTIEAYTCAAFAPSVQL